MAHPVTRIAKVSEASRIFFAVGVFRKDGDLAFTTARLSNGSLNSHGWVKRILRLSTILIPSALTYLNIDLGKSTVRKRSQGTALLSRRLFAGYLGATLHAAGQNGHVCREAHVRYYLCQRFRPLTRLGRPNAQSRGWRRGLPSFAAPRLG